MTLSFDFGIMLFLFAVALGVGVVALLRPEALQKEYEKKIEQLEREIENLRVEYRRMANDYLRIVGENHWLRIQLRAHGIDIPALPEDLRPHTDAQGNISIVVSRGGINAAGQDVNTIEMSGTARQVSAGKGNTQEQGK